MRSIIFATVFVSLLACGCVRSIHPILQDDQVIVDNSLAGTWVGKEGDDLVQVQPAGADKTYKVTYTDDKGKKGEFVMRLGKIGGHLVAEFSPGEPAADMSDTYRAHLLPLYSFMAIHQTAPQVKASIMSRDWLMKYLDQHPDELRIARLEEGSKSDELIVTATTEEFQAFLLRHWSDEGVWGKDETTFVRPGDPTTRPSNMPR